MTIKICTHPEGCQDEPRRCLAEGCQEQKVGNDEFTPEEKAAEAYLKERYGTQDVPAHWIKTVAEYAEGKDALLKEAITILEIGIVLMPSGSFDMLAKNFISRNKIIS